MSYTEIKVRNGKKYYYRVKTIRDGKKFKKKRIYFGRILSKKILAAAEKEADNKLNKEVNARKIEAMNKMIPKIRRILLKHEIKKAGIFGSYARGEQKKNSDVDIIILPTRGMGLEFVGVQLEIEDKLGKKVDLLSYNGIHPLLKKEILEDEVRII